jgi:uncharacterized 2Fe-2S/4Fe-4S cluster protein (DUF4445 family)
MRKARVLFLPSQKESKGEIGRTVLDLAREAGVYIDSHCNGKGKCGKCRIRVLEGKVGPLTQEESLFVKGFEQGMGYRLACMTRVTDDVTVLVAGENVLASGASKKMFSKRAKVINPAVKSYHVSIKDHGKGPTEYFQNIIEQLQTQYGLRDITIDPGMIEDRKKEAGKVNGEVIAAIWMDKEIVAIQPREDGTPLGIALDIGTTTVALYLCDLIKGDVIASGSFTNPQVLFGPDIMSRISYSAEHPVDGVKRMQRELINSVNALIDSLVLSRGYYARQIIDMTAVGNTVMHHIFLGIAPDKLGLWPFEPLVKGSVNVKARQLGLSINPYSYVHVLPVEAGFVGADNVGVLISEEPYNKDELSFIIDIGTNGELVLGNRKQLLSCSCATGPALEGAQISCGMRAAPGAIERIHIDPETFEVDYKVIGRKGWARELPAGGLKPSGICGSGIIDMVAQLFKSRLINANGAFSRKIHTPRLRKGRTGVTEYVVAWKQETSTRDDIVFTQKDVRQVQLAKAALHGGCRVLMSHLNIDVLRGLTIAGAFGMHIDKESALTIGLFPECEPNNIVMVGNAAGHGAYLSLVDRSKRDEANRVARMVTHIELAMEKDFQREFMKALAIPTQ